MYIYRTTCVIAWINMASTLKTFMQDWDNFQNYVISMFICHWIQSHPMDHRSLSIRTLLSSSHKHKKPTSTHNTYESTTRTAATWPTQRSIHWIYHYVRVDESWFTRWTNCQLLSDGKSSLLFLFGMRKIVSIYNKVGYCIWHDYIFA